jgi:ankyrin repeat protein
MNVMRLIFVLLLLSIESWPAEVNSAAEMFIKALMRGDPHAVENLLSSGIDPNLTSNLTDTYGQTPLCLAVSSGDTKIAQLLLAYHADPNANCRNGGKDTGEFPVLPLQKAAERGNLPMASILIAGGAHINATGSSERTALHFALGHLDMMQLLIKKGADVNARDAEGTSPLDDAVWIGFLDGVAILLAHGARLDEADTKTGATPVNEAAYRGQAPVVQYLLRFRPELDALDNSGRSALDNAIRMKKEDCALLLLGTEPKERQTAPFFEKALDGAIRKDEPLLVEALFRHGAAANSPFSSGVTPLDEAASAGQIKIVEILLSNGADPNLSGKTGTTPLEDAALKGFAPVVGVLLEQGALVDRINAGSGTTALYAAASFGKGDVVKLLLEKGANPRLCGRNHVSAYQAAVANGYGEVATALQNRGGAQGCER